MPLDQPIIDRFLDAHPHPLLFVTVSGAHLYGFESRDSDYDLRGCHITPVRQLIGLKTPSETYEVMDKSGPIEMDIVTHDVKKFFTLLLKSNGYVLEQVYSPLVMRAAPEFEELKSIAKGCMTKQHRYHFRHFSESQWQAVVKSGKPTVKGLLYTYRVLLAGIWLMQSGEIESNLRRLNERFKLSFIDDLIAQKIAGSEYDVYGGDSLARQEREFDRLCQLLDEARDASSLPETTSAAPALEDLLIRLRMQHLEPS